MLDPVRSATRWLSASFGRTRQTTATESRETLTQPIARSVRSSADPQPSRPRTDLDDLINGDDVQLGTAEATPDDQEVRLRRVEASADLFDEPQPSAADEDAETVAAGEPVAVVN